MTDRVTQYALDVISGKEVAGRYAKLACKRHLKDLEKSKHKEYKYIFSAEKATENIEFFESLRFTDGPPEMVGKPVKLFPFQDFIIGSTYGWLVKETGKRRFRKRYTQLGRKNAKSLLNSGDAIKLSGFDNYFNAQVYTTATKMKQARIVWEQASKFINIEPDLKELFTIKDHDAIIESKITGGKIMALGRDTGTIDGFDPHGGIIDEYHSHKTNQMVKLLEDGSVNQTDSLISIITTAGFDLKGPCYTEYEYCINILEEIIDNDEYFIYIAQMDKGDDIWNPDNWIKANPLVCKLPQGLENLKRFAKEAKEKGGEDLRNFITKSLNEWYKFSENQYLNIDNWKACGCDLTLEDFRGKECGLGLDLSSGGDLTSGVLEFPFLDSEKNEPAYFFHQHSFMPKNRLAEHIKSDRAPYDVWANEDLITLTETLGGIKTDYKYIIRYYKDLIEKYDLKLKVIAYDPHNADAFLSDLEDFGVDCVEITQSAKNLNTPTEDFQLSVDGGQLFYNKEDGLFRFCGVNAVTTKNSFGEIKLDKEHRTERIDPMDAAIDIHKIMMINKDEPDINELTEDYLKMMGW